MPARHRTILLRKVAASQLFAGWKWRWTIDAQGTMRLMFDTMDAYDRADFDRLAEIYAKDARWTTTSTPTARTAATATTSSACPASV